MIDLNIRPMELEDAEMIVKWRNDPTIIHQMFSQAGPTLQEHLLWFKKYLENDSRQEFVIIIKNKDLKIAIGTIGLSSIDTQNAKAEYGILIGERDYWGQGLAFQASKLLLDHAFTTLELNKVYLKVMVSNDRAVKLYKGIGFKNEGQLRDEFLKSGQYVDIYYMGILKEEWIER